jgi:hypothetical protein
LIKREIHFFCFFYTLAILSPFIAIGISCYWLPDNEVLGTWFQRSGSFVVIFGLLSEARAINCFFILNPSHNPESPILDAIKEYSRSPKILNLLAFILIAIGTFIWGYGDILFKMMFSV